MAHLLEALVKSRFGDESREDIEIIEQMRQLVEGKLCLPRGIMHEDTL